MNDRGLTRGMTLVELLVALSVLGVLLGVSAIAWPLDPTPPPTTWVDRAGALRDSAVKTGRRVSAVLMAADSAIAVTALPDGRLFTSAEARDATLVPVDWGR